MGIWHEKSKRKITGGLIHQNRKTKKYDMGNEPLKTVIGKRKVKTVKTRGGNQKMKLRADENVNVVDKTTKTVKKVKILDVIENKANPHFVRQKIVTKGALLKTELGTTRVTSRPGQNGVIEAVLVEKTQNK